MPEGECDRIDPDPIPVALIATGEISLTKKRLRCHGQGAGKFRIRRAPIQQSQKGRHSAAEPSLDVVVPK